MPLETQKRIADFIDEHKKKKAAAGAENNFYVKLRNMEEALELDLNYQRRMNEAMKKFRERKFTKSSIETTNEETKEAPAEEKKRQSVTMSSRLSGQSMLDLVDIPLNTEIDKQGPLDH